MNCNALIAITVVIVCTAAQAKGAVIVASASGHYFEAGSHSAANANYASESYAHDFFVFDLTGVSGTVASASLKLFNPSSGYSGPTAGVPFDVYDVSTPISSLEQSYNSNDPAGISIYNDLGSGTVFGTQTVSWANENDYVNIDLNSSALAAINVAIGGTLAFGGALAATDNTQAIFGFSDTVDVNELVIETTSVSSTPATLPEPGSFTLFGLGIACMAAVARRRKAVALA